LHLAGRRGRQRERHDRQEPMPDPHHSTSFGRERRIISLFAGA